MEKYISHNTMAEEKKLLHSKGIQRVIQATLLAVVLSGCNFRDFRRITVQFPTSSECFGDSPNRNKYCPRKKNIISPVLILKKNK